MNSNNKVHKLIDARWSPRAFDAQPVDNDRLYRIFEAARRAPSCFNEQPWRFIIGIKGKDKTWDKILDLMDEFNQKWAQSAPVLGLILAKTEFTKNGKFNKHHGYDAGQAAAFLTFQATEEGMYVHQMAGFSRDRSLEAFGIPQGYEPFTVFALGYIGNPEILPEDIRKNESKKVVRKELPEIVFSEWNRPFIF